MMWLSFLFCTCSMIMAAKRVPILFVDFTTGEERLAFYDADCIAPRRVIGFDWWGRRMKTIAPANAGPEVAMYFVKIQAICEGTRGVHMMAIDDAARAERILSGKIRKEVTMRHIERLSGAAAGRAEKSCRVSKPSRFAKA